ncbi:hypothetical protein D3C77_119030 [compost metagenome]
MAAFENCPMGPTIFHPWLLGLREIAESRTAQLVRGRRTDHVAVRLERRPFTGAVAAPFRF